MSTQSGCSRSEPEPEAGNVAQASVVRTCRPPAKAQWAVQAAPLLLQQHAQDHHPLQTAVLLARHDAEDSQPNHLVAFSLSWRVLWQQTL